MYIHYRELSSAWLPRQQQWPALLARLQPPAPGTYDTEHGVRRTQHGMAKLDTQRNRLSRSTGQHSAGAGRRVVNFSSIISGPGPERPPRWLGCCCSRLGRRVRQNGRQPLTGPLRSPAFLLLLPPQNPAFPASVSPSRPHHDASGCLAVIHEALRLAQSALTLVRTTPTKRIAPAAAVPAQAKPHRRQTPPFGPFASCSVDPSNLRRFTLPLIALAAAHCPCLSPPLLLSPPALSPRASGRKKLRRVPNLVPPPTLTALTCWLPARARTSLLPRLR